MKYMNSLSKDNVRLRWIDKILYVLQNSAWYLYAIFRKPPPSPLRETVSNVPFATDRTETNTNDLR